MKKIIFKNLIIFEDDNFIIINKPYDISTLEDRKSNINILSLAKDYHAQAQVCHRLDKETSGVLVLSKREEAYKHLNSLFEKRKVNKIYHAVVDGIHDYEYIMYSAPIKVLKKGVVKIDFEEGKESHTIFNTMKAFKNHTLVGCNPITGRTHQIRIHLSDLGSPIVGDDQYGGQPFFLSEYKRKFNIKKNTEELPIMRRVALHAFSIKFDSLDGKTIAVESEYPKDFGVMLKQMEKYS